MVIAKKLVALGGMFGIFVLAWWIDRLFEFARLGGPSTEDPVPPVVWVSAITSWALAGLVLLLAWFVILKDGGNALVSLIFLLVGLFVTISLSLESQLSQLFPLLSQPLTVFVPASPRSLSFYASAFIAIIGIIGLLARRRS